MKPALKEQKNPTTHEIYRNRLKSDNTESECGKLFTFRLTNSPDMQPCKAQLELQHKRVNK
ncbi:unnamed protein product [Acanthoscelides obtectus]|uniref:Uncharacterized protein n=1 Tax=Acanthoscelides obtectus TaxID=200917 RepID=A0A9P0PHV0_ACAOB|nr:unnamed protein product [Acanthoscelides obtectus]CAK1630571.1 hypothetical protein AOBTE_LOCUS6417 [Acanthoscelides obtectus]